MVIQQEQSLDLMRDVLPIEDIDYVEIYSGNAKQAVFYYCKLFGMKVVAYKGLETGCRDHVSYVLEKGDIRLVITGAFEPDHEIAEFVKKHGDAVKDIALRVHDLEQTYQQAIERGGVAICEPFVEVDELGTVKKAVIGTFGDTVHTLIERSGYTGSFVPGYDSVDEEEPEIDTAIARFDHLAINVEQMDEWVEYYEKVFGFTMIKEFRKEEVSSDSSSLMTKALSNGNHRIKMPIVEPAPGKKKSQVQEFIDYNFGAGVQHVALETDDILKAVENLQKNGIRFLHTPDSYYELLPSRVGEIDESLDELNRLNILVDRDEEGYLLQIFSQPMQDRPTMFFEIIQRKGSNGFGNGNIRALFEAVEREQEKRGNL
ncbi:4-hydroxyphenylpyruvate dioxygenase [Tumebacillus algifaecis]|uniref:4-hydroxyphenylpyruvate dioxygenase n=1 Tax=Tumebacillus algifaecis TaxID=1214604 RepID=A0A223CXT9_9BACL|nr:4-hydroxyphenylpyruvate dioxygenase [Tumebacillus algifaecis]ASS74122.1 4-hydroxyphenylpyruvate dioxygenase [Tumebacillus algifaecis]